MITRHAGVDEYQHSIERRRGAQPRRRIVELTLQRQQDAARRRRTFKPNAAVVTQFAHGAIAPDARHSSTHVVWACMQYAASVRYHRVTLADLSAVSGVSERSVRNAFAECHGMSPTAYLRIAALIEVRRQLLEGPPARDAVTRAATDLGFWHLSRFASQYRALFDEAPSETVVRARALVSQAG
jgi:AraC-like DNA-binding protein